MDTIWTQFSQLVKFVLKNVLIALVQLFALNVQTVT